jgi:hypothetical protein
LLSINYRIIHKNQKNHLEFLELFQQYNVKILKALVEKLELIRYTSKNLKMVKAIYNMSTELFTMDIFNQIITANMLSYYGLGEEFSVKVKDSLSKFSLTSKKITLVEDRLAQDSENVLNVFTCNYREKYKPKLKDTKIFTDPLLNYEAQMQLSEQYFKLFYLKGGYANFQTYDDLIEDQLLEVSDDEEDKNDLHTEFIMKKGRPRNITFSKRQSDAFKRYLKNSIISILLEKL